MNPVALDQTEQMIVWLGTDDPDAWRRTLAAIRNLTVSDTGGPWG